jgi:hypothetical protein
VDAPWHNFIGEILKNIILVNNVWGNAKMAIEISTGNKYRDFEQIFKNI